MFACALNREPEHARKGAVDMVMAFLDPFTTRSNLLVRAPLAAWAMAPCTAGGSRLPKQAPMQTLLSLCLAHCLHSMPSEPSGLHPGEPDLVQ